MGQHSGESGIKVIDRSVAIVRATTTGPRSLAQLCEQTGLPRATVHRLATALEVHGILTRDPDGLWRQGTALASAGNTLLEAARPIMATLVDTTQESVQLYQRSGQTRTCIASVELSSGLRNTVPVGTHLPLSSGSAAKVILAHSPPELIDAVLPDARFDRSELRNVLHTGLAESVSEREVGLASLSAPVFGRSGSLAAVLSVSGPVERLRPSPLAAWGSELAAAARELSSALAG